MTRKQPKRATPKPVEAWGIVLSDGTLSMCAYGRREFAVEDSEPWDDERIIRVRIVPIVKRKKRKERKK